jgi:hypothetical protein
LIWLLSSQLNWSNACYYRSATRWIAWTSSKRRYLADTRRSGISCGGITLDTHRTAHGPSCQGWPSPQDQAARRMARVGVHRRTTWWSLTTKENLFGLCNPYHVNWSGRFNRPVTLPPCYIRWVGTPSISSHLIIQSNKDTRCRVLRQVDGLNLPKSLSLRSLSPSSSYHAHLYRFIYYRGHTPLPTRFRRRCLNNTLWSNIPSFNMWCYTLLWRQGGGGHHSPWAQSKMLPLLFATKITNF